MASADSGATSLPQKKQNTPRPFVIVPPKHYGSTDSLAETQTEAPRCLHGPRVFVDRVAADAVLGTRSNGNTMDASQRQFAGHAISGTDTTAQGGSNKQTMSRLNASPSKSLPSVPASSYRPNIDTRTDTSGVPEHPRQRRNTNYMLQTTSLTHVGTDAVGSLIAEIRMHLAALLHHAPDVLGKLLKQIEQVEESLALRAHEIDATVVIPQGQAHPSPHDLQSPFSPDMAYANTPKSTPLGRLPFAKIPLPGSASTAASSAHIMGHWLYEMQKSCWILNEKLKKYMVGTSFLNAPYRTRKIVDFCMDIRTSWAQLLLELSISMSRASQDDAMEATDNVMKLAIATGTPLDWQEIDVSDARKLYMQGEKYFLGYGVVKSYEIAWKRYETSAKMNLPESATMLGVMLEFGLGREKDITRAISWYQKASEGGNAEAYNNLGRIHEFGKGCEISLVDACKMYKRAAELKHLDGMTNYGHMLETGSGCTMNVKYAIEMYKAASELGYARAQNALGSCLYRGNGKDVKRDYIEAVTWYKRAAEQGFPPAFNNLGICYEEGHGVCRDQALARLYYKKAADARHASGTSNYAYMCLCSGEYMAAMGYFHVASGLGSTDALFHLGTIFESGFTDSEGSVDRCLELASRYYQKAADLGHTLARTRLAVLFLLNDNPRDAIAHLKLASETDEHAQNMLGEVHENAKEYTNASRCYARAASRGHARAAFNLASLIERGLGGPRNFEKATRLYREAAKRGNSDAKQRIHELEMCESQTD